MSVNENVQAVADSTTDSTTDSILHSYTHNFRTTTAKSSPHFGKKRPALTFQYSVPAVGESITAEIQALLQHSIIDLAVKEVQKPANLENWDFVPPTDISALAAILVTEKASRSRVFTAANVEIWADVFGPVFAQCGKSAGWISTVHGLAKEKFIALIPAPDKAENLLRFFSEDQKLWEILESEEFATRENSMLALEVFQDLIVKLTALHRREEKALSLDDLD